MKIGATLRPKGSVLRGARLLVPALFDAFVSHREHVLDHPRRVLALHRMRLSGKPLRYTMEDLRQLFGREYRACVEEVKDVLELMGLIHEADVLIPVLGRHLRDLVVYNTLSASSSDRIPTGGLRTVIRAQRARRADLFAALCRRLKRWGSVGFRRRLLRSMNV